MKHLNYLIEIVVSLAAITLINIIWFWDNPGFFGISPHPYWIVVVGISIKYELKQSLAASFLSSLTYAVFLFVIQKFALAEFFSFEAFKPVLFFIVFATLIGKVRSGQVIKLETALLERKSLKDRYLRLQENHDKISTVNNELADRIMYQTYSYSTIYEMAKKIRNISIEDLFPEALKFISDTIEVEKCSFYILRRGKFELISARGWDEQDRRKSALINSNKIVKQVLEDKEVRAAKDFLEDIETNPPLSIESDVIISVPIIYGIDSKVFGIINIEKILFSRFNSDSLSLLKIVSDWISDSLNEVDKQIPSLTMDQHLVELGQPFNGQLKDIFKPIFSMVEEKED